MADAGKMRDRVKFCCSLNALDEIVGQLARRSAGAISHADKIRHVGLKIANRLIERLRGLWRLWGKKLERKRRRMSPHDFGDMHESALIFVPATTFGQIIPKWDAALQPSQLPKRIAIVRSWTPLWHRAAALPNVSRTMRSP